MSEMIRYDTLSLCPDYRFIRVVSKDGVFYDLVRKWRTREHVFRLQQIYPFAESLGRAFVPPCIVRDFTELDGAQNYREAVWKNGTQRIFPLQATDQKYFEQWEKKDQ